MEKLNRLPRPAERKKIYLAAAKYYLKLQGDDWWTAIYSEGFCDYCDEYTRFYFNSDTFPEYELFRGFNSWFFDRYDYDYKVDNTDRIHALLLAAEMCS